MSGEIKQTLGILAGEGALPVRLTEYCIENDISVCVVQFKRCHYDAFPDVPTLQTSIEKVGAIFQFFKDNHVSDIVMIGALSRPKILSLRPDWQGFKTLLKIADVFSKGDNSLLTTLRQEIEMRGFNVRGVDFYLQNLTSEAGCLTKAMCVIDLTVGVVESLRHGQADKGQSILMHEDETFSFETRAGTTALIETSGRKGSILVKTMKPHQDPDLDRPTVGIETLKALHDNQCAGLVIEASAVLMVNKDEMINYANDHGLFIEVINV